ncbi:MAG: hypothetical protein SGILL_000978 [Bacillariaceae sp.]
MEPLLEFGSSHRIVWIQRLPRSASDNTNTVIQSIGTGIVGSSDEEKSRKHLEDWKEGTVILVPSNGGKAVGWIHDYKGGDCGSNDNEARDGEADAEDASKSNSGPAVLLMAKIPATLLAKGKTEQQQNHPDSEQPHWVNTLLTCCNDGLHEWTASNLEESNNCSYYTFPSVTRERIVQALQAARNREDHGMIEKVAKANAAAAPIPSPVNTPAANSEAAAAAEASAPCSITKKEKCEPCEGLDKSALLSLDQAKSALAAMTPQGIWSIQESSTPEDGPVLQFHFTAKNFQAALNAINAMGAVAEREGHHPNFHLTNYRQVSVDIYTHKLGGLTKNDFVLAEMLSSEVCIEYSPKWLRENQAASSTSGQHRKDNR